MIVGILLQEFTPSPEGFGKAVTMGAFVRDIFLEQVKFCIETPIQFGKCSFYTKSKYFISASSVVTSNALHLVHQMRTTAIARPYIVQKMSFVGSR